MGYLIGFLAFFGLVIFGLLRFVRALESIKNERKPPEFHINIEIEGLPGYPPAYSKTIAAVQRAIKYGEVLLVRYDGGSNPGSEREIVPKSIRDNRYIVAMCLSSNAPRTFRIDRMEILERDAREETRKKVS